MTLARQYDGARSLARIKGASWPGPAVTEDYRAFVEWYEGLIDVKAGAKGPRTYSIGFDDR